MTSWPGPLGRTVGVCKDLTMETYQILLTAAALYFIVTTLYTRFRPSLRSIDGPPLAAWTNLWRFWNTFKGHDHLTHISLHRKYGPLVRIGPNTLSVADPAMIPVMYNTSGEFTKTGFYPLQSMTWHKRQQVNVFSTRDETLHREVKRKVASAYTLDALLQMEGKIDGCGDLLLRQIQNIAEASGQADLGSWLHYYSRHACGFSYATGGFNN